MHWTLAIGGQNPACMQRPAPDPISEGVLQAIVCVLAFPFEQSLLAVDVDEMVLYHLLHSYRHHEVP